MVMFIYPVCGCVCAREKKRRGVCGWVGEKEKRGVRMGRCVYGVGV